MWSRKKEFKTGINKRGEGEGKGGKGREGKEEKEGEGVKEVKKTQE